ncbi:MAG: glycoside hydrolase family 16 protein [Bacteroidota bacterium]|nr:glycoside hydrolase family 16 protein [Bacteroidota bacterium]
MKKTHYFINGSRILWLLLLMGFSGNKNLFVTKGFSYSDTAAPVYRGYRLVWRDEFNGSRLSGGDWNYETGGSGWGNNELEYYTAGDSNAYLQNGNLVIEAKKEDRGTRHYTSARITTAGKHEFQYGRIDIRAKLPVLPGMWPALWMLGNDINTKGWPYCGEIDIMELIGKNPKQVVGSFHWKNDDATEGTLNNRYDLGQGDFSQSFHLYSLIWKKDQYEILVDNNVYVKARAADIKTAYNPFNHPFYLIFNVAVGGDWPGPPDQHTAFPQKMLVDYVRVYQH